MKLILLCLVLTLMPATSTVHADSGTPNINEAKLGPKARDQKLKMILPKLQQGCDLLGESAVQRWLAKEESEQIRCLNAAYIPSDAFAEVLNGFKKDCMSTLTSQIQSQLDGRDVLNLIITKDQLNELFRHNYEPVFQRYCAEMNPQTLVPKEGSPPATTERTLPL